MIESRLAALGLMLSAPFQPPPGVGLPSGIPVEIGGELEIQGGRS